MSSYIFLTENYSEGSSTTYYAIPEDKIETMALSDTYSNYGQQVSAHDAGDSFTIDTEEAATKINNYLEEEEREEKFKQGDYISAYEHCSIYSDILNNVEFEKEEIEHIKQSCDGFNYWDGHNWRTVTTSLEHGESSYAILEDEELIKELNEAIENKEFEKEGFGKKVYTAEGWVITDNYCQGTWASFEVMSKEDYEVTMY